MAKSGDDGEESVVRDRAREEEPLVLPEVPEDPPDELEDGARRALQELGDLQGALYGLGALFSTGRSLFRLHSSHEPS